MRTVKRLLHELQARDLHPIRKERECLNSICRPERPQYKTPTMHPRGCSGFQAVLLGIFEAIRAIGLHRIFIVKRIVSVDQTDQTYNRNE